MTISIPENVWTKYHEAMTLFLTDDHFSQLCKVYYPPIQEICANCNTVFGAGASNKVFQHGGPAPFGAVPCVYCGGNGYREKESTGTLRLRLRWGKKEWINAGGNVVVPDSSLQIIGYTADLDKIIKCIYILIINNQTKLETRFTLNGQPFFHGFGKSIYFIAFLKKV